MPLVSTILAFALALLGTSSSASQLPATLPGIGRDEGVFLITAADDGSRVVYFVAQNQRHAILEPDLQIEQQLNALWPVRTVARDEILAYAEGAPVGHARTGLVSAPAPAPVALEADDPAEPVAEIETVVAETETVVAETETVVAEAQPAVGDALPALYVLKPGDDLTHISRDYGTTIEAILHANGISNANRIYAGQALVIPTSTTPADSVAVAEESSEVVVEADQPVPTTTYTVMRGDNAIGIARQIGVEVEALLAANGIADRNRIYVGQILTIPGQSS